MVEYSDNLFMISGARIAMMEPGAEPNKLVTEYMNAAKAGRPSRENMDSEVLGMLIRAEKQGMLTDKTKDLLLRGAQSEHVLENVTQMVPPQVAAGIIGGIEAGLRGDVDIKLDASASEASLKLDISGKIRDEGSAAIVGGGMAAPAPAQATQPLGKLGFLDRLKEERARAAVAPRSPG